MTYELAKKLKETGFEQRFDIGRLFFSEKFAKFGNIENIIDKSDKIAIPLLSELIDACGEGDFMLTWHKDKKLWLSSINTPDIIGEGSTPEEAVAHLWLALNKK